MIALSGLIQETAWLFLPPKVLLAAARRYFEGYDLPGVPPYPDCHPVLGIAESLSRCISVKIELSHQIVRPD